jgi:hypothetical protein
MGAGDTYPELTNRFSWLSVQSFSASLETNNYYIWFTLLIHKAQNITKLIPCNILRQSKTGWLASFLVTRLTPDQEYMSWIPRLDASWIRWHHEYNPLLWQGLPYWWLGHDHVTRVDWATAKAQSNSVWYSNSYSTQQQGTSKVEQYVEHAVPKVGFILYFQGPKAGVVGVTSAEKLWGGTDIINQL